MKRILLPRALAAQTVAATTTKPPHSIASEHAAIILQATDGAEVPLSHAQATQSLLLAGLLDMVDGEQDAIIDGDHSTVFFSSWPENIGASGFVLHLVANQLLA